MVSNLTKTKLRKLQEQKVGIKAMPITYFTDKWSKT